MARFVAIDQLVLLGSDPKRLEDVNPALIWGVIEPPLDGVIVDIGAGGFLTLPFAQQFLSSALRDILPGMLRY